MAFTLNNSNATSNNGAGATLGVAVTGVTAGDLVFVTGSCFAVTAYTCSDGTTTLTPLTQVNQSNSGGSIRGFYLLSSVASGTVTYTITFTGTPTGRNICVYVFHPSAAVTFDQATGVESVATTAGSSGNITTTGTDELSFGAQANENQSNSSLEKINSVARTAVINSGLNSTLWYLAQSSTYTGPASETIASSTRTCTIIAAFKIAAGAAAKTPYQPAYLAAPVMAQ
jgi:hypothetical protein